MAKLGTKKRPAIVHVRTQARAEEIVSIFAENGWQFILGIESDKPENIADLTRLLNAPQPTKAKKVNGQISSKNVLKSYSKRKSNPPLRSVRTGKKKTKPSSGDIKVSEEACEYVSKTNLAIFPAIISCGLSMFFLVEFLTGTSLWYVFFLALSLLCFLIFMNAIIFNQRVILHGNTITILRRMRKPITANVADAMYQIRKIHGSMFNFIFRFDNGRKVARVTPSAYKNGDQLLQQLTAIIDQENIVVEIIEN